MKSCHEHSQHIHEHGPDCGHQVIRHEDHLCYLHEGHLHFVHRDHVDEHKIAVTEKNPNFCSKGHKCLDHDASHSHGPHCGHEMVPHGDHFDYLVNFHLHCVHNGHCDHHGQVEVG